MESSVWYISTRLKGSCISFSPHGSLKCYVIWFEPFHGTPTFSGQPGFDIFPTMEEAKEFIRVNYDITKEYEGKYFGGYRIFSSSCTLFLITEVKNAGKYLDEYPIYSISSAKFLSFPLGSYNNMAKEIHPDDISKIEMFSQFPVRSLYFCPLCDISSSLYFLPNPDNIWNINLIAPFQKFGIENLCVSLLEGKFLSFTESQFTLYLFFRRRHKESGSFYQTRGISQNNGIGNEVEVEIIIKQPKDNGFQLLSHTFVRGTTPLAQTNLVSSDIIQESFNRMPRLFHRLFLLYNVSSSTLIDLSDHSMKETLYNVIESIKGAFDVSILQYDWETELKLPFITHYITGIIPKVDEYQFSSGFFTSTNSEPLIEKTQSGVFLITSPRGCDRCNVASFFTTIKIIDSMLKYLNIRTKTNLTGIFLIDPKYVSEHLLDFIANSFITSGDLFSKLYLGTRAIIHSPLKLFTSEKNIPKFSPFFISEDSQNHPKAISQILPMINSTIVQTLNKSISTFESVRNDIINKRRQDFLEKDKINNELIRIFSGTDDNRISHSFELIPVTVISPQVPSKLFSNIPCFIQYDTTKPLLLSLSKPVKVTEIIFEMKTHASTPIKPFASTVSIYSGFYANRLYPLFGFQHFALLQKIESNDSTFKLIYHPHPSPHYEPDLDPNLHEPVRFLEFHFASPLQYIELGNIYVYGEKCPCVEMGNLGQLSRIPVSFSGPLSQNDISEWEKARILALMTYSEFMDVFLSRNISPTLMSISWILRTYPNQPVNGNSCAMCSKVADFKCCMCQQYFCLEHSHKNDVPSKIDGKNVISFCCDACFNTRTRLNKCFYILKNLKISQIKTFYPFVGECLPFYNKLQQYYSSWDFGQILSTIETTSQKSSKVSLRKPIFFSRNFFDRLPRLIYSVSGPVNPEMIFIPGNKYVWRPRDNFIMFNILLPSFQNVSKMTVKVESKFYIEIESMEFTIEPPITVIDFNSFDIKQYFQNTQRIDMKLIGNIAISQMLFEAEYVPFNDIPTEVVEEEKISNSLCIKRFDKKGTFDKQRRNHVFSFKKQINVYGLVLEANNNSKINMIVVEFFSNDTLIERQKFQLCNFSRQVELLFETIVQCNNLKVWYLTFQNTFEEPEVYVIVDDVKKPNHAPK